MRMVSSLVMQKRHEVIELGHGEIERSFTMEYGKETENCHRGKMHCKERRLLIADMWVCMITNDAMLPPTIELKHSRCSSMMSQD